MRKFLRHASCGHGGQFLMTASFREKFRARTRIADQVSNAGEEKDLPGVAIRGIIDYSGGPHTEPTQSG
jgi:hypothetical protein